MTQDNNFAERLKRIEERGGAPSQSPSNPEPIVRSGGGAGQIIAKFAFMGGFLTVIGVGAVMFLQSDAGQSLKASTSEAITALGDIDMTTLPSGTEIMLEAAIASQTKDHEASLAEAAIARAATLIAPARPIPAASTEPATTERMGTAYGVGFSATLSGTPVAIDTILTGFQPSGPNSTHGDVNIFDVNEKCTLRPIGTTEKLVNVNVGRSNDIGPVQIINTIDINDSIRRSTKEALADGLSLGMMQIGRGQMGVIDVIVTDTSGPLYLALQTFGANMLWNIHAAPGVDIAHVAMISNGSSALTGNIGNASFEAIRAHDFGNQIQFYDFRGDPEDLECMARPFRKPDASWGAWEGAKGGNTLDGNLLYGQDKGFDAYDYWFTQTFGVGAAENLLSATAAGAVLIGDAPAQPIPAATAPTPVYVPTYDMVLTGTQTAREQKLVSVYSDMVAAAAGGAYQDVLPDTFDLGQTAAEAPTESDIGGQRRSFGDMVMRTNDIDSKVSLTELNRARRVSFSTRMTLDDLLHAGEAMPAEEHRYSYALMRAPRQMMPYCADTLIEIASKCRIFSMTVHDAGDGEYQVRADFAYVPNYTIGDVERIRGGDFITASLPDDDESPTHQTAQERRAFLVRLKNICDQLRPEYGNCLIGRAMFNLDEPSSGRGNARTRAAGWVEVYMPDNPFEERNFQERVEAVLAEN